jgi:hypothetical protein
VDEFIRYPTDVPTKVDTYQQLGTVGGAVSVGAMDGAIEPHGRVYGVPATDTAPPSHGSSLLLLPLILQVQGCKPCRKPPWA